MPLRNRLAAAVLFTLVATSASAAELVVSAAASLTNAFRAVAQSYEKMHPGNSVVLNFGASDVLMQQIVNGAPADVFASADQEAMNKAEAARVVAAGSRKDFAANGLVLIAPADSKLGLKSIQDLARPEVRRIAYGNPSSVPVGRYTRAALEAAGLWEPVAAKGVPAQNVRQSLDYVARGEVDAGFVFSTDAAVMPDKVKAIQTVPTRQPITYPVAITAQARQPALAASFVAFLSSPEAQEILARYGFRKP